MEQPKEAFMTVFEGGMEEIIVKKSRFIATVSPVQSEEEAEGFIEGIRKKYWDASHNCYAYIIGVNNPILRCYDDGEPGRTAGKPILDVLLAKGLHNLAVVVTRYFGGTLLGTGGLVKAYQSAAALGLEQSQIIKKEPGIHIQLTTDYNLIGKIQYYIGQENFSLLSSEYTEIVKLDLILPIDKLPEYEKKLADLTNGLIEIRKIKEAYFAMIHNEVHLFS